MTIAAVALAQFRFKASYDEAYRLELAKLGANPVTACGCLKQKAGMRALNRLMDDTLVGEVRA